MGRERDKWEEGCGWLKEFFVGCVQVARIGWMNTSRTTLVARPEESGDCHRLPFDIYQYLVSH